MKTCTVVVRVFVGKSCEYDGKPDETRTWKGVDVMNTAYTRGWATRQFNTHWRHRKRDTPIRVEWECRHDDGPTHRFSGSLSGVNDIRHRRGIFDA